MEQRREPTNRNRIGGVPCRTSERKIAKSRSTKGAGRRSGGCALKVIGLTPGDLHRVPEGTEGIVRFPERGAEVSRGHSRRRELLKARTVGEVSRERFS